MLMRVGGAMTRSRNHGHPKRGGAMPTAEQLACRNVVCRTMPLSSYLTLCPTQNRGLADRTCISGRDSDSPIQPWSLATGIWTVQRVPGPSRAR